MKRYDILTDLNTFKGYVKSTENLIPALLFFSTPPNYDGTFGDYMYEIITKSQPNLTKDFCQRLDDLLVKRAIYRINNNIKSKNEDEYYEDAFMFVVENMQDLIDKDEEDSLFPKSLLTDDNFNVALSLYDPNNEVECRKYVFKHLTGKRYSFNRYIKEYIIPEYEKNKSTSI